MILLSSPRSRVDADLADEAAFRGNGLAFVVEEAGVYRPIGGGLDPDFLAGAVLQC